ncbi:MAG: hypothetical protein QM536_09135 [Chitinophagaceae bacterium]|nr:hypothetical protein [Chitinophagaceae bacterium]
MKQTFLIFLFLFLAAQSSAQHDSPNTKIILDKIFILGNKKTKNSIITREMTLQENTEYDTTYFYKQLVLEQQKIFNTRLFNSVRIEHLQKEGNRKDIIIHLEERWYLIPIPAISIVDRNFNDWWVNRKGDLKRLYYGGTLYHFNMTGRGDELRVTAHFGFLNNFILNYSIPYIDKKQKNGISASVLYTQLKNIPYKTTNHIPQYFFLDDVLQHNYQVQFNYTHRPLFYIQHNIGISYRYSTIMDTVNRLNEHYFQQTTTQQYPSLTYQFTKDTRNYRNYPLRGYYFTAWIKNDGLWVSPDIYRWGLQAYYSHYFEMPRGFYFSSNITFYTSIPLVQPYYNYYGVGASSVVSLRGYELDLIEGYQFTLLKTTFKKKIYKFEVDLKKFIRFIPPEFQKVPFAFYGKFFIDGGYVNNYPRYFENIRLTEKVLYTVGIGIDFVTFYDRVFRFEYSYNSQGSFNFFINFKTEF